MTDFDLDRAERYDRMIVNTIPGYETIHNLVSVEVALRVPAGGRVLVFGAGTGQEILNLVEVRPDLAIVGVDPSGPMLDVARRRLAEAPIPVDLVESYDVPKGPFDAALMVLVMHFVDRELKLPLLTALRNAVPAGFLAVVEIVRNSRTFESDLTTWRELQRQRGVKPEAIDERADYLANEVPCSSESELMEMFIDAGFRPAEPFYRALWIRGYFLG